MTTAPTIVVGIDGGQASIAALEAAIREAGLRHTSVVALTCWPAEGRRDDSGPLLCKTYAQAAELLDHVITEVSRTHPHHVPVISEISQSFAGPTLVGYSRRAELVVLGSTTRGAYGRHNGRRTIEHCLRYAECPVLIVPWTAASLDEADIDLDLHQPVATD